MKKTPKALPEIREWIKLDVGDRFQQGFEAAFHVGFQLGYLLAVYQQETGEKLSINYEDVDLILGLLDRYDSYEMPIHRNAQIVEDSLRAHERARNSWNPPGNKRPLIEAQGAQGADINWTQEWIEKGEQQTRKRIARRMLTRNDTLADIQELTELSPMEIIPLWREERAQEASVTLPIDERHAHATRDRQIIRELLAIYDDAVTVSELSDLPVETILAVQREAA